MICATRAQPHLQHTLIQWLAIEWRSMEPLFIAATSDVTLTPTPHSKGRCNIARVRVCGIFLALICCPVNRIRNFDGSPLDLICSGAGSAVSTLESRDTGGTVLQGSRGPNFAFQPPEPGSGWLLSRSFSFGTNAFTYRRIDLCRGYWPTLEAEAVRCQT